MVSSSAASGFLEMGSVPPLLGACLVWRSVTRHGHTAGVTVTVRCPLPEHVNGTAVLAVWITLG